MNKYIEALLAERNGYEKRGLKERVKAVDAALRELGFDHKYMDAEIEAASFEPKVEKADLPRAKKRTK
jgi:hypothetical protein